MCQYKMPLPFAGGADHLCVKNVICVQDADLYGHGGHSPAFVPTFGSVLPTRMVRHWQREFITAQHLLMHTETANAYRLPQFGILGTTPPQVHYCHCMKSLLTPAG